MHTTVRIYKNQPGLADLLLQMRGDVQALLSDAKGFESYQLIRTADGAISITTCEDRAGCDEATALAAKFLREKGSGVSTGPTEILDGDVIIEFAQQPAGTR